LRRLQRLLLASGGLVRIPQQPEHTGPSCQAGDPDTDPEKRINRTLKAVIADRQCLFQMAVRQD
jgi:hypothetical protein